MQVSPHSTQVDLSLQMRGHSPQKPAGGRDGGRGRGGGPGGRVAHLAARDASPASRDVWQQRQQCQRQDEKVLGGAPAGRHHLICPAQQQTSSQRRRPHLPLQQSALTLHCAPLGAHFFAPCMHRAPEGAREVGGAAIGSGCARSMRVRHVAGLPRQHHRPVGGAAGKGPSAGGAARCRFICLPSC